MAVTTTKLPNTAIGITYSVITDSSSDWASVSNDVYFFDKATDLPYYKNASGTVVSLFEEGGGGTDTFVTGGTYSGSTIVLNRNDGNSVDVTGITSSNIYTADGTVSDAERVVTLTGNKRITYLGGRVKVDVVASSGTFEFNKNSTKFLEINGNIDLFRSNFKRFENSANQNFFLDIANTTTVCDAQWYSTGTARTHTIRTGSSQRAHFNENGSGTFIVGGSALIGSEDVSLQGDTLVSKKLELSTTTDGFLMPRLTTAQKSSISSPDTDLLIFNTDTDAIERYDGSVWVSANLPNYVVRSGGVNTPYSDFKTALDAAPAGAILEVNTSETIDVGMPSTYWDWTKDLTIQTNGHDVILTNLSRIQIASGSNLNTLNIIGGGTFSSSALEVFTIYRNLTINSDGATNIICTNASGILFQALSNVAGTTFTLNNVKSVGTYKFFSKNSNKQHATILNHCYVDLTNTTSTASLFNHKKVTANNCVFKHSGGTITYPQNVAFATVTDEAFVFNNCDTVGNFGRCMLRLNNCYVTTTTTTNHGIYQVTLEANNTSFRNINTSSPSNLQGYAITASNELVILKNCTIDSDWGGVYLAGKSSVIDNCTIKSGNSWGVFRYNSGANLPNFLTIRNSTIESDSYSTVGTNYGSLGKQFDISNTTIITSGASSCCLSIATGTHARFDNLKLKNKATPGNILNRATLLTENPQINTLDNLGNIVLA